MDTLRQALRSLLLHPLRAGLTVFGMIIGVAAIVALMLLGRSVSANIQGQIASLGPNLIVVTPGNATSQGVARPGLTLKSLTMTDSQAIATQDPDVVAVAPLVQAAVGISAGSRNSTTVLFGTTASYATVHSVSLAQGRFFTPIEVAAESRVVVVGTKVAQNLFGSQNPIGQTMDINGLPFVVIGELVSQGTVGFQNQDDQILVPISIAMHQLLGVKHVSAILASARSGPAIPLAMAEITKTLHFTHHLAPGAANDFSVNDQAQFESMIGSVTGTLTVLLSAIAGISLVVAGIGIMNIMLVSVTERTREIGLRMAIGAPRSAILLQFLAEALVLSGLGGTLGVAAGGLLAFLIIHLFHLPWDFSLGLLLFGVLFSLAVGVVFGVFPALQASRLRPIEALRHD